MPASTGILKHFRFSAKITTICVFLAGVMLWCSSWQWERYKEKKALIATYVADAAVTPTDFPMGEVSEEEVRDLQDRRVRVRGTYDFDHQLIVTNRKHASGPGHWLFTPLRLEGSESRVMVSRGFIPFADLKPQDWTKYNFSENEELDAVVKPNVEPQLFGPENPDVGPTEPFQTRWFYPEITKMARQLPYPVITSVYLQRIGAPPHGQFPAQSILVEVPPSTHFGYTIEWILLAIATLLGGFAVQAFPRRFEVEREPAQLGRNGSKPQESAAD